MDFFENLKQYRIFVLHTAQKSSLCSPHDLRCKAHGVFDPIRGGLCPLELPHVFWQRLQAELSLLTI